MSVSRFVSRDDIFAGLQEASTLADAEARPYQGADFSIEEIPFSEIKPTQFYEIVENTRRQEKIRNFVMNFDEDILRMAFGGIEFEKTDGSLEIMLPPIVEESREGLLLLDGTHRSLLARKLGMKAMNFLRVSNIYPEFDMAERRLPNEWSEIKSFETVGDLKIARKNGFIHRREGLAINQDNSYRDFSHLTGRGKDERK